jgi:hypothetical protein
MMIKHHTRESKEHSGVVRRRDEEVGEGAQLVVRELLLVVTPVVVMRALKVAQASLHSQLYENIRSLLSQCRIMWSGLELFGGYKALDKMNHFYIQKPLHT